MEYILDTVVNELWANKDRRFSYGEMVGHFHSTLPDDTARQHVQADEGHSAVYVGGGQNEIPP